MAGGFVSIDRKITKWEWYKNVATRDVFLHCLFTANWKESTHRGVVIPRGSLIASRRKIADETGLSEQQVRTALINLQNTHEITIKATNRYSLISIVKYDLYQNSERFSNQQDNQQTTHELTDKQPTNIRTIEQLNNIKRESIEREPERKRVVFAPPSVDDVKGYCQENGYKVDANRFVDFYESKGWMVGKNKMKDWKAAVRTWARSEKKEPKKDGFSNFKEREDTDWDAVELALLQRR